MSLGGRRSSHYSTTLKNIKQVHHQTTTLKLLQSRALDCLLLDKIRCSMGFLSLRWDFFHFRTMSVCQSLKRRLS
ncbi:hypothetical protein KP509_10G054700 [Ceratopteris richardii]|uniref:Uncharacterized protein n=1 Tax=Ceratopteris richardii TaxID=49495 RepID=A0A8T2TZ54_CERRI|nr:hypothetical protein KP509_10G054700 [Ceratopteris richardii]